MASMNVMDARRYVKVGQAAVVVLGLSAAVLWAADLPGLTRTLPPKPEATIQPVQQTTTESAATATRVNRDTVGLIAENFERIAKVDKPKPVEETPVTEEELTPEPTGPGWAYLGPIQEPSRLLALIQTPEGHQKVLAEGRRFGETRLVSVMSDEIIVEDSAGRHRIPRAPRGQTRVAWVTTMPSNAPIAGAGNANGGPGNVSPEVRVRLIERGIDPDRFPQQMRARRNRGGNGGNGPGNLGANGAIAPGAVGMTVSGDGNVTFQAFNASDGRPNRSDAETAN